MNKKKSYFLFSLLAVSVLFPFSVARAVCPVCTIFVGLGLGLSRWLGIDDAISGVWLGGLIISFVFWTLERLEKRQIRFRFRSAIVTLLFYLFTLVPLFLTKVVAKIYDPSCGINHLLLGITIGSPVFLGAVKFNEFLKKKNNDKVYFPYQKVVIPLLFLLTASLIVYLNLC